MILQDLIKTYKPIYPEGRNWDETVAYLYAYESAKMEELENSILTYGIRQHVYLGKSSDGDIVQDGTHRVAVAIKHRLLEVPVIFEIEPLGDGYEYFLSLEIGSLTIDFSEDELFDEIATLGDSFKINEDIWMTSMTTGGDRHKISIVLETEDEAIAELARDRFEELLKIHFPFNDFVVGLRKEDIEDIDEDYLD